MLNEKMSQNNVQIEVQQQVLFDKGLGKGKGPDKNLGKGLARLISKRKQHFDKVLKNHPPEPPWDKHPGYSRSDQFWRTGAGNHYLMEYIWPYNRYSTKAARQLYRNAYPEPENWAGWYSE